MLIRKIRLTALFFLAVLAVPVSVSADGIDVGIRVGLNSVTNNIKAVGSPSGGGSDRYTGFFAGPVLDIHLPAFFSIDLSALYSHKGLQLPDENNFIMQAIALPVMAKFTFPLGESVGLFAQAGPQINFNIGELEKIYGAGLRNYELNKQVWSFNIGGGIVFFRHLHATVNYNLPLSVDGSYTLKDYTDQISAENFKSSTLQFVLTYMF